RTECTKFGSRTRSCRTIASASRPRAVSDQVDGSKRQSEEAVSKASETGVTRARRMTRPSSCSCVCSTGSDLDVPDFLLGLLFGGRQHSHLLLERLELVLGLLAVDGTLKLGQPAVQVGLTNLQACVGFGLQLLDLVAGAFECLDVALDGDAGARLVELLLDLCL